MKLTFEEWKKQYCAEPTPQILDDLRRLHNIKDPKAHILHMQKNAYIEYAHNEWLKDNPGLVIQEEPAKQASDKSTLLGELLDHNVPKSEREHVAAAEIERLNQMLRETGYGQGQIDAYAAQCEEVEKLKKENEQLRLGWCKESEKRQGEWQSEPTKTPIKIAAIKDTLCHHCNGVGQIETRIVYDMKTPYSVHGWVICQGCAGKGHL